MKNYIKENDTVLEIGVGTSFTANYLKSKNINVTTIDIDKEKKPDIVGNIVDLKWEDLEFDHILAFEVFEHIPFEEFNKILSNLRRFCKKNIFISLPVNEKCLIELEYKLPKLKKRNFRISMKRNKITTEAHFWEVGFAQYSEKMIENVFSNNGLRIAQKIRKSSFVFYALEMYVQDEDE